MKGVTQAASRGLMKRAGRSAALLRFAATWRTRFAVVSIAGVAALTAMSNAAMAQRARSLTVFPLEGEPAALRAPLTKSVVDSSRSRGLKVTEAGSAFADTALLLGCDPETAGCQKRILGQIGTSQAIYGTIAPAGPDRPDSVVVSLTLIKRKSAPVKQSFTVVGSSDPQRAAQELSGFIPALFGDAPVVSAEPIVVPPDKSPSDESGGGPLRMDSTNWALVGGGGGLVATGAILWLSADSKQGEIDDAPTDTVADLERLEDLESSARTRANIGNVLVAAGLIAASVGVVRAFMQGRSSSESPPPPGNRPEVTPMPVQGGAGLTLTWRR